MNKAKQMQKNLVKFGAITGGVIVVGLIIMLVTGSLASSAAERKTAAENARNNDTSQISTMRNQIAQSGDAEKRFIEISLKHTSSDFSANTDTLKNWLRAMKDHYRLSDNFKLTLANEKKSDKTEFSALNYDVTVREPMRLEFGAISDVHVLSFVRQLEQDTPGMVRITKLGMIRKADINATTLRDLASGAAPDNVSADIEFTWIGIAPKEEKKETTAPTAAPGGPPGGA